MSQKNGGGDAKFADYVDVAERIRRFYAEYPEGSIRTEMVHMTDDGLVVFKASVYRDRTDPVPSTGWAYERENQGYVNKTSFIENCETSAIGRAIANAGVSTRKDEPRPSRQEMEKAERMRREEEEGRKPATNAQLDELATEAEMRQVPEDTMERLTFRLSGEGEPFTVRQAADALAYVRRFPLRPGAAEPDDGQAEAFGQQEQPQQRRNAVEAGR